MYVPLSPATIIAYAVTSPLADLTILTVFAAQTNMAKHIKTVIVKFFFL